MNSMLIDMATPRFTNNTNNGRQQNSLEIPQQSPLAGVKVLDFSSQIAGPYCTKLLADAGADVVKVESGEGDSMRRWSSTRRGTRNLGAEAHAGRATSSEQPPADEQPSVASSFSSPQQPNQPPSHPDEPSALFCYLNASKRSVIGAPGDRHIESLLCCADIVVEDFTPQQFKQHNFLNKHPHLVVVSVTPYGHSGPLAGAPWTDFTVQAECGSIAFRGRHDQPPVYAGGRITEYTAGAYAAPAALAALLSARTSGQGQHLDVSIAEVGIISQAIYTEVAQQLHGDNRAWGGPTRSVELPSIEPTKDGRWVGFNTNTGQQAENFLMLIERFDLLESGEWSGPAAYGKRMENIDEWNEIVHAWTTRHTQEEIIARAVELRIPVAPVHNGESVLQEPHFLERSVFVNNPAGFLQPRPPYLIDDSENLPVDMQPAPQLGEHTDEVVAEWGDALREVAHIGEHPGEAAAKLQPVPPNEKGSLIGTGRVSANGSGLISKSAGEPSLPFEGFRIIDLTSWWAGPSATQLFALMGAEVIHIESGSHPDGMRLTGAMFGQPEWWEWGHMFVCSNTNKFGLTLDLNSDEGHGLLCKLIAESDVVVENFSPRVAEKFGLTFDFLKSLNPQIVYMRMPAFGLSGPWRERVGFAQTMEQVTGMAWVTGHEYDQPRIIRGPCDPIAGMHGAFALMLGLCEHKRKGEAVFVEATMVEAALNCAAEQIVEFSAYGGELSRMGNRSPYAAPQGLYACAGEEEWLGIAIETDEQWEALVGALGNPAWAQAESLADSDGRRQAHDLIDDHLAEWARDKDSAQAAEHLRSLGIPAARCCNPRLLFEHPQYQARGFYERSAHPFVGEPLLPTLPYRLAGADKWIKRATPTIGQHNREILGGLLGVSDEELSQLSEKGVIATRPAGM